MLFSTALVACLAVMPGAMAKKKKKKTNDWKEPIGLNETKPGIFLNKNNPVFAFNDTKKPILMTDNWKPRQSYYPGEEFRINMLSDLHLGENATWDNTTLNSIKSHLITDIPANLWVLNGDIITGQRMFAENATVPIRRLRDTFYSKGNSGPPPTDNEFASVYGPHDNTFNLSASHLVDEDRKFPLGRTRHNMVPAGPDEDVGESNYYIPIHPYWCEHRRVVGKTKKGKEKEKWIMQNSTLDCPPAMIVWFFDSRGGELYQKKGKDGKPIRRPNWVHPKVVSWFLETNANITKTYGREVPSAVFFHIPIRAFEAARASGILQPKFHPGQHREGKIYTQGTGWCSNGTYAPKDPDCEYGGQDMPLMKALMKTKRLISIGCSHNHGSSWTFSWDSELPGLKGLNQTDLSVAEGGRNIALVLGPKSGMGGYGDFLHGYQQFVFFLDLRRATGMLKTKVWSWSWPIEDITPIRNTKFEFHRNKTKERNPTNGMIWGQFKDADGWNLHGSTREEWEELVSTTPVGQTITRPTWNDTEFSILNSTRPKAEQRK